VKKVLIITYHWPPSGGISVLRCLKIAKYLRHFGWEPIVYAPLNAQYEFLDDTNFNDIPQGITVLKHPIIEPFNLFKKVSGRKPTDSQNPVYLTHRKKSLIDRFAIWARGNFFIPDARCLWIRPSVRVLSAYLKQHKVDAIFSDGPPHTNTVIAMRLAKKFKLPWLADFQDPWTQVDYYTMFPISRLANTIHHRLEQQVFKTASKITIASPTWATDLEQIGAKNVSPLYYGYDEDDFNTLIPQTAHNEFSIAHAGLLGADRHPGTLLTVLSQLVTELPGFGQHLRIDFAGLVDYSITKLIDQLGLAQNYRYHGKLARPQALQLICNASILLLPLNKAHNAKGRIPGKLFELLRANHPILCLGPSNADSANIVAQCQAGQTFDYDDAPGLKQFITHQYQKFVNHTGTNHTGNYQMFSNYHQTKVVAGYLNSICGFTA
jgi:glycosyltransferase involved in cell wall biosynthesis